MSVRNLRAREIESKVPVPIRELRKVSASSSGETATVGGYTSRSIEFARLLAKAAGACHSPHFGGVGFEKKVDLAAERQRLQRTSA
jgi:hypothetical protein